MERRRPDDDPAWIRYFDESELAAEFGHCLRDLGRASDAAQYASQSVGTGDGAGFVRSDFFATMVLADAHLAARGSGAGMRDSADRAAGR